MWSELPRIRLVSRRASDRARRKREEEMNFDLRRAEEKLEREHREDRERAWRKRERQTNADDELLKWREEHSKKARAAIERKGKWVADTKDVNRSQDKEQYEQDASLRLAEPKSAVLEAIDRGLFVKELHSVVSSPTAGKSISNALASQKLVMSDYPPRNTKYFGIDPVPHAVLKGSKQEHECPRNRAAYGAAKPVGHKPNWPKQEHEYRRSRAAHGAAKPVGHKPMMDLTEMGKVRRAVLKLTLDELSLSVTGLRAEDPKSYLAGLARKWITAVRVKESEGELRAARDLIQRGCNALPGNQDIWMEAIRLALPAVAEFSKAISTFAEFQTASPASSFVLTWIKHRPQVIESVYETCQPPGKPAKQVVFFDGSGHEDNSHLYARIWRFAVEQGRADGFPRLSRTFPKMDQFGIETRILRKHPAVPPWRRGLSYVCTFVGASTCTFAFSSLVHFQHFLCFIQQKLNVVHFQHFHCFIHQRREVDMEMRVSAY